MSGRHAASTVIAILAAAAMAVGCAGSPAASPPAGIHGILAEIARRGASATDLVSGDTGCPSAGAGLTPNAFHLRVSTGGVAAPADVYVFLFATRQTFTAATPAIDACAAEYARAASPGPSSGASPAIATIPRLAISPYHAFGARWSPELTQLLRDALTSAAGDGGDPRPREPG